MTSEAENRSDQMSSDLVNKPESELLAWEYLIFSCVLSLSHM